MDLEEVLRRARTGDAGAMGELYRGFAQPMLSYLGTQVRRREDAEDLVGEVFLSAVRDLKRFDGDASGFRAWLYRIATNRAIDLARRQDRRPEQLFREVADHADDADPERDAIAASERAALWAAVRGLPAQQRLIIGLRLAGGLTSVEIAQIVGKRVGAVKALQHRALANLTRALRPDLDSDQPEAYPHDANPRLDD